MYIFHKLTKKHKHTVFVKTVARKLNTWLTQHNKFEEKRRESLWNHTSHMIASSQVCKLLMLPSSTHLEALTKVDVVISSSLAVHLVDKEAGHRLEQQAEDGHPRAEAKHVPPWFCGEVIYRVIDPKMDNVGQYRHDHPHQKLRGKKTTVTLLYFNCMCQRGKVLFTLLIVPKHLIIMPRGNFFFAAKNACGKQTHSHSEKRALWGEMR